MIKNIAPVYIGIDVAKATLQVHAQGRQTELANESSALSKLCTELKAIPGAHVVCEATGGYQDLLVNALHQSQIPVSVLNPAHVRASAHAQGKRAKTDRIDAQMLTDYGQRYQPKPTPPVSEVQQNLSDLTQWLKQLVDARAIAKTQAEHHQDTFVEKQNKLLLKHFDSQIKKVETQLQKLIDKDQELRQRVECLYEIDGVGLRTAILVLASLPELGHLNRQEVAALAGLAPWTRESGTMKGVSAIGGGRPEVRLALYMAALTASRCNPILAAFYQHLISKGKPFKVALTAVMRRLLVYMNSKLKALAAQSALKEIPQNTVEK